MATNTFTCFPNLPAELRLIIWEEALSVRTVWAASRAPIEDGSPDPTQPRPLEVAFLGPAPYLVGLSCSEARRVMEKSYVQLPSLRGGPSAGHWVDLDKTVVYLGTCDIALDVLSGFRADEVAQFKHIALDWHWGTGFIQIIKVCRGGGLADSCPALETLVATRVEQDDLSDRLAPWPSWDLEGAAFYADLAAYTGPVRVLGALSGSRPTSLSWVVLACFPRSFPRLHLLSHQKMPSREAPYWNCSVRADLRAANEGSQG